MTRKRFVKLLMAYGYSRNSAQAEAEKVNKRNTPYKKAIKIYKFKNALRYVGKATVNVASLGAFALALKKMKGERQ